MFLKEVDIFDIDLNSPFFFRSSPTEVEMYESVRRMGLLSPPIAYQDKKKFIPITGRSRLYAAREAHMARVPLMIYDDLSDEEAWKIAIEDAISDHELSEFEKSKILKKAVFPFPKRDHTLILKLLDVDLTKPEKEYYKKVASVSENVIRYLERYGLSKKQTKKLVTFPSELLDMMSTYAEILSIRPVEMLEITGYIFEAHRSTKMAIAEIIEELKFDRIVRREDLNRNQKIDQIKKSIRQTRYPVLTEVNGNLDLLSRKLPGKIKVTWDKTLESSVLEIRIDVTSTEEIEDIIADLKSDQFNDTIKAMSEILQ